jgi:selenophosphate synthetase-related protein
LLGSLAMLLEPTRCGVSVQLSDIPTPDGVDIEQWLLCFPCFVFLVAGPPELEGVTAAAAAQRGLVYAPLGTIDASGVLSVREGASSATVIDLNREGITRLAPPAAFSRG